MSRKTRSDPVANLGDLIHRARAAGVRDANAAALATVGSHNNQPSIRTVYVHVGDDQLVFFVNAFSGKGKQLQWNRHAALCFFLRELQTQVTVEGPVQRLANAEADQWWEQRSRDSTLAARSSDQKPVDEDSESLSRRIDQEKAAAGFTRVARPQDWVGYQLRPTRMQFWETGWQRMRYRHLFERTRAGGWQMLEEEP